LKKVTLLTQFLEVEGGTDPIEAPKPIKTKFSKRIF
jgi:hypothetical protein